MSVRPARKVRARRCLHCGKSVYRSYRLAEQVSLNLPERGHIYWHPQAGGYCISSKTQSEKDATQAAWLRGEMSA